MLTRGQGGFPAVVVTLVVVTAGDLRAGDATATLLEAGMPLRRSAAAAFAGSSGVTSRMIEPDSLAHCQQDYRVFDGLQRMPAVRHR